MNRAMFSGVAGLKTHQTKMDVIGNNIANVNTYGYKSQRTVFSDMYYQTLKGASAGTANRGGTNPSSVGYGSTLSAVQTQMSQSSMQNTGFGLDVAIVGEGFLQVMDPDGNTFYTKAGLLDYDANGYLTDINGNFVLGGTGSDGATGSQKIRLDNVGAVDPASSSITETIHNIAYKLSGSNNTAAGNVAFNFASSKALPDGVKATAKVTSTGINVTFNATETFASMTEVNTAINNAIIADLGGKSHEGGTFTMEVTDPAKNPFAAANMPPAGYYTGAQLTSDDYKTQYGKVNFNSTSAYFGGIKPTGTVGATYSGVGALANFGGTYTAGTPSKWTFSMDVDGVRYTGEVDSSKTEPGKFNLYRAGGDTSDCIEMDRPSFDSITAAWEKDAMVAGSKAEYTLTKPTAALTAGESIVVGGLTYNFDPAVTTLNAQWEQIKQAINADKTAPYTADIDASGAMKLTAKDNGVGTAPTFTVAGVGGTLATAAGTADEVLTTGKTFAAAFAGATPKYQPLAGTSSASSKSYALGLSTTGMLLKGGTEGGMVTLDELSSIAIGSDGTVSVTHAEKGTVVVGKVTLASFANPSGLQLEGSNYYSATVNSGEAKLSAPGTNGTGALKGSALEMSNVDMSAEFADMITTQRGFQANSRIITVSDTMLEELINLKR